MRARSIRFMDGQIFKGLGQFLPEIVPLMVSLHADGRSGRPLSRFEVEQKEGRTKGVDPRSQQSQFGVPEDFEYHKNRDEGARR